MNRRLTWPDAFALVFGGVPLVVIVLAAIAAYPGAMLPLFFGAGLFTAGTRIARRRTALAQRAALDYPRNAAIVAAPLPPMPTVPIRRATLHDAPTQPRRRLR